MIVYIVLLIVFGPFIYVLYKVFREWLSKEMNKPPYEEPPKQSSAANTAGALYIIGTTAYDAYKRDQYAQNIGQKDIHFKG